MSLRPRKAQGLRAMIIVPVYNEQKNIENLLLALGNTREDPRIEKICVVSSSTDLTNSIIRRCSLVDSRIVLLQEDQRRGKASAWNASIGLAEQEGFDVVAYLGGDNLPCENAISLLLDGLEDGFGIAGGRPIPTNSTHNFIGWHVNLLWNMHHCVSKEMMPKISGELCAFKVGVVREMPPAVINDDAYLERIFEMRGYGSRYIEDARVLLRGPSTLKQLIGQRRRVYIGHHQIRTYTGQKPPTLWYRNLRLLRKALPSKGIRGAVFLMLSLLIEGAVYTLAKIDFYAGNLPYRWKMAETTKLLKYGI
jgi:glycosyltransferase involved in cell wall biosynthesis